MQKLKIFCPSCSIIVAFPVKLKQVNVETPVLRSPIRICLPASLSNCLSIGLSVWNFSQEWVISSLEYLKTDRALFSWKTHSNIYFFILIFICIDWNMLPLVFYGNNPKWKLILLLIPITYLAKFWFLSYEPYLLSASQIAVFFKI